eukprot:TRINITY_DN3441_c0_g1_i1.p1 TRINITY_DN3441_c0_g1~~TRINITY_DN3441_c0_g1_i1.p1  ORF type:complete len:302 (+),score=106.57 TRINITY_DN3441_c0_g1_i1:86-991(+)
MVAYRQLVEEVERPLHKETVQALGRLELKETTARMALFGEWELYQLDMGGKGDAAWRTIHASQKRQGLSHQIGALSATGQQHGADPLVPEAMQTWLNRPLVNDCLEAHRAALAAEEQKQFAVMDARQTEATKTLRAIAAQVEVRREQEINLEKRKGQSDLVRRTRMKLALMTRTKKPPPPKRDSIEVRMELLQKDPMMQMESRKFLLLQRRRKVEQAVEELRAHELDPAHSVALSFGRSPLSSPHLRPHRHLSPLSHAGGSPKSPASPLFRIPHARPSTEAALSPGLTDEPNPASPLSSCG